MGPGIDACVPLDTWAAAELGGDAAGSTRWSGDLSKAWSDHCRILIGPTLSCYDH